MNDTKEPKFQRGAVHRTTAKPVLIMFPHEMLAGINQAVQVLDTDRSKFVRNAVRAQLDKLANFRAEAAQ